jgi:hypothetical protein
MRVFAMLHVALVVWYGLSPTMSMCVQLPRVEDVVRIREPFRRCLVCE